MMQNKEFVPIDEFSDMWDVLTQEERMYLRENTKIHHFKKNQIIYCEGEEPSHLICLIKGKVKIYKEGTGGRNQIVMMIKPKESFAYRAFLAEERYMTNAATVEATSAYFVPLKVIYEMICSNNKLAFTFIKILSKELGKAHNRTVNLTQKHIRGRLAEAIVNLAEHYGFDDDGVTINICLSREDLANISNMTTANAIRTLSSFVSEGMLSVRGRHISVLDYEKLLKISKIG
ncbi:MAG TPA: Crp/Fnr family transcriptional regulator [Paludibacteraceae bacterium]|nr:Crp/Fnr family transcriptional regulator [Paludibacteraceae bacterium]HQO47595.1 Crp/Fnr family transcriptional regulator [Paludibacteraceae bacterium]